MPSTKPLELTNLQSRRWMTRLLMRAEHLGSLGEVPVSAVVIDANGRCIGHGSNQRQRMRDPLGHAELIALRQAAWLKSDWRFNDCTLIVTLEPCPMCAAALTQARMGQVIFAARDPKRGGLGSTINLADHPSAHHQMIIQGGVMEVEARQQLEAWFKRRRQRSHENEATLTQTD